MRVEVITDERGRRLAIKRADDPVEAARLRREADLLDVATHPGLVELVDFVDGPQAALSTTYVEGGTLAGDCALEPEEVAGAAAAVASTLADLHGLGLVHGAVAPEHVLLDGDGRPVLCSVGYGGLAGERRPAAPGVAEQFVDSARADEDPLDPTADVYGAGALVVFLLAKANGRARGGPADALRRVAERATSPVVADRPTARQLADDIHDQVPGARLPRSARAPVASPRLDRSELYGHQRPLEAWRKAQAPISHPSRGRLRAGVAAMAVIGAVAVGLVALRGGVSPPEPSAEPVLTTVPTPAPSGVTSSVAPTTSVPRATTTLPRAGCPGVSGPLTADVDGDGCADEVRYVGGVVEGAGRRWQVGEADDVIALGDWSCTGSRTLAVLRPASGEVFAFSGWASADHQVEAPLLARVAGGRALRAADLDADGCNELVVERADGAPAVLRAPRSGR